MFVIVNDTKPPLIKFVYSNAKGSAMVHPYKWIIAELQSKESIHHHIFFKNCHIGSEMRVKT